METPETHPTTPDSKFFKLKSFLTSKFNNNRSNVTSPINTPQSSNTASTVDLFRYNHTVRFQECDTLFYECADFHKKSLETIELTAKSQKSKVKKDGGVMHPDLSLGLTAQISKWRAKRKGSYLFTLYEGLAIRLENTDREIKSMMDDALRDTSSLTLQSKHLRKRLLLCIDFNQDIVNKEAPVYNEVSVLLESLREQEQSLQYMLVFFDEISALKSHQGQAFIPWALRVLSSQSQDANDGSASTSADQRPRKELKRTAIQKKLNKIVKMRKFIERNVAVIESNYQLVSNNLSHCRKSLKTLEGLLRKISAGPVDIAAGDGKIAPDAEMDRSGSTGAWMENEELARSQDDDFLDTLNIKYDHSQCSDCSCVYTMCNECFANLGSAYFVATEATKRFQTLASMKEQMRIDSQQLESCDWGGP